MFRTQIEILEIQADNLKLFVASLSLEEDFWIKKDTIPFSVEKGQILHAKFDKKKMTFHSWENK